MVTYFYRTYKIPSFTVLNRKGKVKNMKLETKENLVNLFGNVDLFNEEFPVIASCIKEKPEDDSVWSNEESLHLVYNEDEECLTVTGILNVIENNRLLAVNVLIENEAGKQWTKKYAPIGEISMQIKETFKISSQDACRLTGKLTYLQIHNTSKEIQQHNLGATKTMMSVKSSSYQLTNSICGFDIRLFHPCKSLSYGDEIVIVYGAPGGNQYDYNFRNGRLMIPIAMVLKLKSDWSTVDSFTLKRVEATNRSQGAIKYNGDQIRLVTGATWNTMSNKEKEKYPVYGEVKDNEFVLLIALDWGYTIAEFAINKSEFLINADFEFILANKNKTSTLKSQLMLRSVRVPKPYTGGDEYEIPYLYLMNDCVKSDTIVAIKRNGKMKKVNISEVLPGDYVQTKNQMREVLYNLIGSTDSYVELQVNGKTLSLTGNHSVYTKQGWTHANELVEQDMIFMEDQNYYKIERLQCGKKEISLNSLVIKDEHAYYANGFYVGDHNLVVVSKSTLQALPLSKELREELIELKKKFQ